MPRHIQRLPVADTLQPFKIHAQVVAEKFPDGPEREPWELVKYCESLLSALRGNQLLVVPFEPHFTQAQAGKAIAALRRAGYSVSRASEHETKGLAKGWGGCTHFICVR